MSYNDVKKTRIKSELVFFSEESTFTPKNISVYLGIQPTTSWLKGDKVAKYGTTIVRKESRWGLDTDYMETRRLDSVLSFLSKLNIAKGIDEYLIKHKVDVRLNITVKIWKDSIPSLFIDRDVIKLLSRMNGEIDIDMYLL